MEHISLDLENSYNRMACCRTVLRGEALAVVAVEAVEEAVVPVPAE